MTGTGSADVVRVDIKARGECALLGRAAFDDAFCALPGCVRSESARSGLPGPDAWRGFLDLDAIPLKEFFLAFVDGACVARCGVNLSPTAPRRGYLGFFEADVTHDTHAVAVSALIARACAWLESQGAVTVFGPVNLSTWFSYRFRVPVDAAEGMHPVGAGETESALWEPIHPSAYPGLFLANGFAPRQGYNSQGALGLDAMIPNGQGRLDALRARGFLFRDVEASALAQGDLRLLHSLTMECFAENFLFEPIPFDVFQDIYVSSARKDALPGRVTFAFDTQGAAVGFFFTFRQGTMLVAKTIGLKPCVRSAGLSTALFAHAAIQAKAQGMNGMVAALMMNDIVSQKLWASFIKGAALIWRHDYILYEKALNNEGGRP